MQTRVLRSADYHKVYLLEKLSLKAMGRKTTPTMLKLERSTSKESSYPLIHCTKTLQSF